MLIGRGLEALFQRSDMLLVWLPSDQWMDLVRGVPARCAWCEKKYMYIWALERKGRQMIIATHKSSPVYCTLYICQSINSSNTKVAILRISNMIENLKCYVLDTYIILIACWAAGRWSMWSASSLCDWWEKIHVYMYVVSSWKMKEKRCAYRQMITATHIHHHRQSIAIISVNQRGSNLTRHFSSSPSFSTQRDSKPEMSCSYLHPIDCLLSTHSSPLFLRSMLMQLCKTFGRYYSVWLCSENYTYALALAGAVYPTSQLP